MEPSGKIRVNQVGYAAGLPQRVVLLTDEPLIICDHMGKELRRLVPDPPAADAASGEAVTQADLGLRASGTYFLMTGGERRTVRVQQEPWAGITNALIRGLYF